MENEEQLIKIAKEFGNGAHIFVPKEWAGEQVIVIKKPKKSIKERIIEILEPYFEDIIGAYLYGSYAREEQKEDSDIDLFIVTNKKMKIKEKGFEINCIEEKSIGKAFKIEPLIMYSIISEAKVIINSKFLEELKNKYKPKLSDFKEYFDSCKRLIEINKTALQNKNKEEYISGEAVPYSLVLRLRGIFIIRCLLQGKKYSHKEFINWIRKKLPEVDFISVYNVYRDSKNEIKTKQKIKTRDLSLLLELLKNKVDKLKNGKT